jgi:hypothetical protein
VEEVNHNNLQLEDHQAAEEVEVEEAAEANQQPDNKLQDKPQLLPSPRPWDFPPSIDGDISHADDPMELDDPE